jgi:hypothetical protein
MAVHDRDDMSTISSEFWKEKQKVMFSSSERERKQTSIFFPYQDSEMVC